MSENQSALTDDDNYVVGSREVRSRWEFKVKEASQSEFRSSRRFAYATVKGHDVVGSLRRKEISVSKFVPRSVTWHRSSAKSIAIYLKETAPRFLPLFPKETDFLPQYLHENRLRNAFDWLHALWHKDVYFDSSATNAINHPAYQVIIALGPSMIPLILDKVRNGENHWSKALSTLTGSHPSQKDRVNSKTLREYWLNWAEEHQDKISVY